ncbi:Hydroxysteroid dehydrogenase-like protein 2 [Trichinella zimbabwensis]|uniref:Hydroxysteroid dehydrogenase-like protein 2 n=1 Tax=Trichinella zimbabwensis TaxID=268475 RepID=A0A0V1H1Y7_9BILA|nr:Hydroxysteroid dehydrogenase-like protein 2 [Trichinella zimbabwensis]
MFLYRIVCLLHLMDVNICRDLSREHKQSVERFISQPIPSGGSMLAGKTVFITGASRGIGKAIALKVAQDGANVVVAAKTDSSHPKLEGTVHSAVEEINKAGGQGLACVVDVRKDESVENAVETAVKVFGGIDILVNNASAISLTGTQETSMKLFDLMNQINCRGTFLASKACIPYLKQSKNAHILNISPPLNMKPIWFKNHVAYTMAKYSMSMCVLGMSEELKPLNIAVNALWPRTAGGDEIAKRCRKVDIVADAAHAILTRDSRNFTGNFCIDEQVLREAGVTDFNQYSMVPGNELLIDLFLDESENNIGIDQINNRESSNASTDESTDRVSQIFTHFRKHITSELIDKTKGIYVFNIAGAEPSVWHIDLKSAKGSCGPGEPANGTNVDVWFNMSSGAFVSMFTGQLKPTVAFMSGKMKVKGNMGLAFKLEKVMNQIPKQS